MNLLVIKMLDFFVKKESNKDSRARPVGSGKSGMGCVLVHTAICLVSSFDMYLTDSIEGSTPFKKHFGNSRKCIRRGSRWLAFFIACKKFIPFPNLIDFQVIHSYNSNFDLLYTPLNDCSNRLSGFYVHFEIWETALCVYRKEDKS